MPLDTDHSGAACLICGCTGNGTGGSSASYVYDDWVYYHHDWYDDDFWIWVDEHPDCCDDQADLKEALQDWYDNLDPGQQQAVRDRVQIWMDEHGVVPAAGQSARDSDSRDRIRALDGADSGGAPAVAGTAALAHRATLGDAFAVAAARRPAGIPERHQPGP